jgi:hypothetical protein
MVIPLLALSILNAKHDSSGMSRREAGFPLGRLVDYPGSPKFMSNIPRVEFPSNFRRNLSPS